jgi:aspartyl-tRNA(Asn)/glutamyl-tRNA(Gln) amidotransferase subunit B
VSLIDYNRSGVPLMEIVTEPDLRSAAAARDFFATLREHLMYLGVCDGNLQEGSMRADINISLRNATRSGAKVEIKNLNSFRAVYRAIEFEVARQSDALRSGQPVLQETRGWSEARQITVPQRSKEFAHDYRYFPEPDLPPISVNPAWLAELQTRIPEMPDARRARLMSRLGLSPEVADVLTADLALGRFFDATLSAGGTLPPALAASWITGDLVAALSDADLTLGTAGISPQSMAEFLGLVASGTINGPTAKDLLPRVLDGKETPQALVERLGLSEVSDASQIAEWVDLALSSNPRAVRDYLDGKEKALQALVGQVMKQSRGKANVDIARMQLTEAIERRRDGPK